MPGGDGHGLIKIICVHGVDGIRDDEKDSNTFSLQSLSDIAAQTSEFFQENFSSSLFLKQLSWSLNQSLGRVIESDYTSDHDHDHDH